MAAFDHTIARLKAAAEPTRLRLLKLLQSGEYSVKDLTEVLGQSQPRVSRHVKLLAEAGLIERNQEGSFVFVRAATDVTVRAFLAKAIDMVTDGDFVFQRDQDKAALVRSKQAAAANAYFNQNASRWTEIRSLHVPEANVEHAVSDLLGTGPFDLILDLGTGTGRMLELLSGRATRLIGVDSNREMMKYARANLDAAHLSHCSVRQGDLYDLPFAEASVDAIVIHQVLHFLENPKAALAEAARVLKPGGRLLIVDFAPHDVEFLRDQHAHLRLGFGTTEMSGWLAEAGMLHNTYRELDSGRNTRETLTVALWLSLKTEAAMPSRGAVSIRKVVT